MVHISRLENRRVEKVEDVVSIGDEIIVKVIEIDQQGRINLSRKDALADIEAKNYRSSHVKLLKLMRKNIVGFENANNATEERQQADMVNKSFYINYEYVPKRGKCRFIAWKLSLYIQ